MKVESHAPICRRSHHAIFRMRSAMPRAVIMKVLGCFPRIELSVPWHDGPQGILLPSQIFPWLESLCGQGHFFGTLRRKGGHAQVFSQIAMQKRVAELLYI